MCRSGGCHAPTTCAERSLGAGVGVGWGRGCAGRGFEVGGAFVGSGVGFSDAVVCVADADGRGGAVVARTTGRGVAVGVALVLATGDGVALGPGGDADAAERGNVTSRSPRSALVNGDADGVATIDEAGALIDVPAEAAIPRTPITAPPAKHVAEASARVRGVRFTAAAGLRSWPASGAPWRYRCLRCERP